MRQRNVKNKQEIIKKSKCFIEDLKNIKGKWQEIFQNDNPIHVEIGMGKGKFLMENAKRYKDINFIGIEKYDSILALALKKIPEELNNLKIIRLDALKINEVFDEEITTIYLNFSDPWPKKRHEKRRLTSPVFLEKYDLVFKENCHIVMKTDNNDLFEYSTESISEYGYKITYITRDLYNEDISDNIPTEYEKKFVSRGIKINKFIAIKE